MSGGGTSLKLLVFLSSFSVLSLELIINRVANFHLGYENSFLAIPITLFGLAVGSLYVHLRGVPAGGFDLRRGLTHFIASAFFSVLFVMVFFGISFWLGRGHFLFSLVSVFKIVVFILVFSVPFFFIGRVFAVVYMMGGSQVGVLYGADLTGAALACFTTPVLFHFLDLPALVSSYFLVISVFGVYFSGRQVRGKALLLLASVLLCTASFWIVSFMEDNYDFENLFLRRRRVVDVAHGWNEFSRVALLSFPDEGEYLIVHDAAYSGVGVRQYSGDSPRGGGVDFSKSAFLLNRSVNKVLVMFAGCGYDMIYFNEYSGGRANVTGVELNPLVREIALTAPELSGFGLAEFYGLPNVNLELREGRSFLQEDEGIYDVVCISSHAATAQYLTAHSRKYLDTIEAFRLYLDHMDPNGVLLYYGDMMWHDVFLANMKTVLDERGFKRFNESIVMFNYGRERRMLISPTGFSRSELEGLLELEENPKLEMAYAPGLRGDYSLIEGLIEGGDRLVTDDRPFLAGLGLGEYSIISPEIYEKRYSGWAKITTLMIVSVMSSIVLSLAYSRKSGRLPKQVLAYLFITGFCYLVCEIVFIAKLELFLQNPFISMATVLSIFLMTSGFGSIALGRIRSMVDMRLFPFIVCMIIFACFTAVEYVNRNMLGDGLAFRLLMSACIIAPVGLCLGVFYPYAVLRLSEMGREDVIPITYGISTVSSVIGAVYAMTVMVELGFRDTMIQAIIGYFTLGFLVTLTSRFSRRNYL
ncbi:MAG: hypothetical protein ABIH11_05630 [Candidatus Altiarchaeota archaeon]